MTDLNREERDALIAALDNDGELLVGTPIEPYWSLGLIHKRSFATQDDDGTPLLDSTWELTPAGTLLAQSLKREREARKALDKAVIAVIGLDAKCRSHSVDPGDYFDRVHASYMRLRGETPPEPDR